MPSRGKDKPSTSSPQKRTTRRTRAAIKAEETAVKIEESKEAVAAGSLNSPSSDDEDLKKAIALSLNSQSSDDEDMKRAKMLSKSVICIESDNDEDMKKALEMSLKESSQMNRSAIVISDDEEETRRRSHTEPESTKPSLVTNVKSEQSNRVNSPCKSCSSFSDNNQEPQPSSSVSTQTKQKERRKGKGKSRQNRLPSRRFATNPLDSPASSDDPDWEEEPGADDELYDTCTSLLGKVGQPALPSSRNMRINTRLSSEAATLRMRGVFERGLEAKLNNVEMEACRAVKTKLHPHQKAALAWMVKHENTEHQGMLGGILADEMGLGKTLTVLALIMTNFYDGKPLAKPRPGFVRQKFEVGRNTKGKGKGKKSIEVKQTNIEVGKKIVSSGARRSAFGFFSKFNSSDDEEEKKEKTKFTFGKAADKVRKRSKSFINDDETSEDELEEDEFDAMLQTSSKLDLLKKSSEKVVLRDPRDEEIDDLYEEWQGLTEEEKHQRSTKLSQSQEREDDDLDPALNLDGAFDSSSDSSYEDEALRKALNSKVEDSVQKRSLDSSTDDVTSRTKKRRRFNVDTDSDDDNDEVRLSDIDLNVSVPQSTSNASLDSKARSTVDRGEKSKTVIRADADPGPMSERHVKRIVPPKDVAVRGNRARPTLILCPTSLINHWCSEIDNHVDPRVNIKVKVHHGQNKARLGADLNTYDVVISTYGTLAKEYDADVCPLIRAKWLRVVLDEGHLIKNRHAKTTKAANLLNTSRRWIITGTPIQNNLTELWSLVNWLQFDLYADCLPAFVHDIEHPCKLRQESGFERLQTLMDTICLRRTKNDKKSNGEPMVVLPKKTVILRDVTFTEEEKLCYAIFQKEATDIVKKYQRRGELLRNYAHIFALMMRMRQLCCHRELIDSVDWELTLRDKDRLQAEMARFMNKDCQPLDPNDGDEAKRLANELRKMIRDGVTEDCSICLDDLNCPVITPCAHVFCRACIERVLETLKPPVCPLCRGSVKKPQLLEAGRDEDERPDGEEGETDATLQALNNIQFNQSSSKVNAAIKEMLRIREEAPDDKIILVSQFTSFLSMFQPILKENEFKFVRLDGTMSHVDRTEVVNLFQKKTESSPKVLLLSMKAGGVGLNLTAANHLLLLDPAWNPAAEWQCFDRIHRMGQEKDVQIYKFITKEDSIEEKMMAIQAKKEELISGAFHMPDEDRRRQRINDILNIFNLAPASQQNTGGAGPQM